ncbi:hypothetical protein HU200_024871 [Digitaria exilis]|uniref:Uncharacterized protein n=1 Tax=Digitaria exilis TaxID=1010633 RepID=A0A835C3M8_9POAL|nr:hypothetical protein HU200_024871 [Digitaria exilis]
MTSSRADALRRHFRPADGNHSHRKLKKKTFCTPSAASFATKENKQPRPHQKLDPVHALVTPIAWSLRSARRSRRREGRGKERACVTPPQTRGGRSPRSEEATTRYTRVPADDERSELARYPRQFHPILRPLPDLSPLPTGSNRGFGLGGRGMDQVLNKVGSYWFSKKASKEIDSIGDDISHLGFFFTCIGVVLLEEPGFWIWAVVVGGFSFFAQ